MLRARGPVHPVGTAGLRSRMTHALPALEGQPCRGHLRTRGLQRALRRDERPARRQGRMRGGLRSGQQREPRDRGHVTAEAPEAEPRAGCGLPGGAAPTCPCSPGECGSPRGLTCPRPPPPSAHYVMPRHAPAQPTGARAGERKHTVHVARAAGPCEGGGRRTGSPGLGIPAAPRERRPHRRATPRPALPARSYPRSVPWRSAGCGPHRAARGCRRWGSRARLMGTGRGRLLRATRQQGRAAASCGSARRRARQLTGEGASTM